MPGSRRTVSGEGSNLSAGASVNDRAGNSTSATVSGLRIDRTAPTTSASVPSPNGSGWYNVAPQVTLAAQDALSGVATTFYSVDGAAAQTYSGPFTVGQGTHTVTFWSVDNAGNVENSATGHSVNLRVDTVGPVVSCHRRYSRRQLPAGWLQRLVLYIGRSFRRRHAGNPSRPAVDQPVS